MSPTMKAAGLLSVAGLAGAALLLDRFGVFAWFAARHRWRRNNVAARRAGCLCGLPATWVRRAGGTLGGVPCEVYTCDAHRDVGVWNKIDGGPWQPASYGDADDLDREIGPAERVTS